MKKIALIINFCFVLLLSQGMAQTPLQRQIEATSPSLFSKIDLLSIKPTGTNRSQTLNQYIKSYAVLEVNTSALTRIASNSIANLEIDVPLNGTQVTLQLMKSKVVDENTVFSTQNGKVNYNPGAYYNGIIKGQSNTLVAISFFNNSIIGVIANDQGNYVLGNSNTSDRNSNEYIIYNDRNLLMKNDFNCGTSSGPESAGIPVVPLERMLSAKRCVKVYIEADYDLYVRRGSDVNSVTNFVTGLFNITSTLYLNESISIGISKIVVWTVPDPYTAGSGNTTDALFSFKKQINKQNGFIGDLALLISSRTMGGGLADTIGALCLTPEHTTAVSGDIDPTGTSGFPTYSWNAEVVTHELGHCLGSQHTHACAWNGNNTAIDGCSSTEGGCADPGIPAGGGTIMSYCHHQSVGINFNLGFGPQPGDRIRAHIAGASCVPMCCPSDITISSVNYQPALTTSQTWIMSSGQTHISSNLQVVLDANPANGYVLLATNTSADYFLSDPTANGSFVASALYGCIMPLSVSISGPRNGNNAGTYTWTAVPSLPAYQIVSYAWSYSIDGVNYTSMGISSSSVTQQLPFGMNLYLRVSVTSVDGQVATSTIYVTNSDARIMNVGNYDNIQNIEIVPNPNNGVFILTLPSNDVKNVLVYDFTGKIVFKDENVRGSTLQINITDQPVGIYLVKTITGDKVISKTIIKQ